MRGFGLALVAVMACSNDLEEPNGRILWRWTPREVPGPIGGLRDIAMVTVDEDGWHMWAVDSIEGTDCSQADADHSHFHMQLTPSSTEQLGTVAISLAIPADDTPGATLTLGAFVYSTAPLLASDSSEPLSRTRPR